VNGPKALPRRLLVPWLLAAASLLAVAPAAHATWLAPVDVSEPGEAPTAARVVLDTEGDATAVWSAWGGQHTVVMSSYRPAGEAWQKPVDISEETGETVLIAGEHDADYPRVAVDGAGDVTVVWERSTGTDETVIQAASRPTGEGWQAPVDISEPAVTATGSGATPGLGSTSDSGSEAGSGSAAGSGSSAASAGGSTGKAPPRPTAGVAGRATAARYPAIGCDDQKLRYQNRKSWRYAPSNCETGGGLGSSEGIAQARWHDWGARRATATGLLIDGLGYSYPATITAYDLVHGPLGRDRHASWYRWLHVVARRRHLAGAWRGPFNVTIDVAPQPR
jgi:hypothetical protein